MTTQEINLLRETINPDGSSSARTDMNIQQALVKANDKNPTLLFQLKEAIESGECTPYDIRSGLRLALEGRSLEASGDVAALWLELHLTGIPLVKGVSDVPELAVSAEALWVLESTCSVAGEFTPSSISGRQIQGALVLALITNGTESGPYGAGDLEYLGGNVEQVQPLIPELRKRGAFDQGTIEMLLAASVAILMDGEL